MQIQRKGSLPDVSVKGGNLTPVNGEIKQTYQRFSDLAFNGISSVIGEIQQQQIYPLYQNQQQQITQALISPQQLQPKPLNKYEIMQMRSAEKTQFPSAVNNFENHENKDQNNKKNALISDNLEIQDNANSKNRQYPYCCKGILKQEENPDDLFAEAILIGPFHIIVLASEMKKLILTQDQNITKRLFFQYEGKEINVKDFFLNSVNVYAIALLEKDVGSEFGYLGIINAKTNYLINQISKNKNNGSSLINISHPTQTYEITDISCKQLRVVCQKATHENETYLKITNPALSSRGWYLVKDEQLGYCVIGYCQVNTLPFINTSQIERWMSSSDVTISPDNFSFVATSNMEIKELTDQLLQKAHTSGIYKICRINHEMVVSSSCDNSIKFWNPYSSALVKNYKNDQCCRNFCISEDQQYLFGTCDNYIFRMRWKQNFEIDKAFSCQEKIYSICKVKVDEKTGHEIIASGDAFGNIYIIDGTLMQQIQLIPNSSTNINGHNSSLNSICRINNNQIATAGGGGLLKIWMWEDGLLIKNLEGHSTQKNIYFVEKHPEKENQLITASSDQTIRVWDITTGQQVKKILVNNSIYCASFLNEYELAVGDFNLIRIFNLRTWQYKKIEKHTCRINTICSLNERSFISGDIEGNIFLFNFDEDQKNQEILIEGIQGDPKMIPQNQNNISFNKSYRIIQPSYQYNGDGNLFGRMNTDQELSFEKVENQSIQNPENSNKALHALKQQSYQDSINQRNNLQSHYSFGQQLPKIINSNTNQHENQLVVNAPLNSENFEIRCSILPNQKIPTDNDNQQKSNFTQIKDIINGQALKSNENFLFSDKKEYYYNYKNSQIENICSNNSFMNVNNPANIRSHSEKKNGRRCNSSFEMEPIRKDNALVINGKDFNQSTTINREFENSLQNQSMINQNSLTQSAIITQKLMNSQLSVISQQSQPLQIQQHQQSQLQQQQQFQQFHQQRNLKNNPEKRRSSSVVKTVGGYMDEVFIPSSFNVPQNDGQKQLVNLNNNNISNNNLSQSSIINQAFPNQHIQNDVNQYPQSSLNGSKLYMIHNSSSSTHLNNSQINQNNSMNNKSQNTSMVQNNNIPLNSPNNVQQNVINNITYQKQNNNPSNANPSSHPMFNQSTSNQHQQHHLSQLNCFQQQINNVQNTQTNLSAQKDLHSSQIQNSTNQSHENLHKISAIASSNKQEAFGQKVRNFTRTPEKNISQQSLVSSQILNLQKQNQIKSNLVTINNQYQPQILRDRNQGNVDYAQQNQSYKVEIDESVFLQKDSKIRQTYENHITHLKSEILKLEQTTTNKNEVIAQTTKEKAELYETINKLTREIEIIKESQEKENDNKMELISCSQRLSELNQVNEELINKIQNYQDQEKMNQLNLKDLVQKNNTLTESNDQYSKKNSELESLVFVLKQQLQEKDSQILKQQKQLQDTENQNNLMTQKLDIAQKYNEEEVKNLQKQLSEKEKYIANILKQGYISLQSMNDKQKALFKYFSEKESISDINPFDTENNQNNTYLDQDSILFKIEKEEEKTVSKFINIQDGEQQNKDLKEKYKKIEIMASLRSAQDEVLNLKSQLQKLRQEYGDQVELTDKYNLLNESFRQKTQEVDNWRKIYNEIYEKQK